MRNVSIIGIGQTPVAEHWDSGLRDLAAHAARAALDDAGLTNVDSLIVANAFGAAISSQSHLAPLIADFAGLRGVEAYGVEVADGSGGAALRAGYLAVASGAVDTVMVLGVEKSTDMIGSAKVLARNVSLDADDEAMHGATLPALAALIMRRYMFEYEVDLASFEGFSINAHTNGSKYAHAMYRNILKPGAFVKAPMIADPVNLFDSAPDGDGAAAVILTATPTANAIRIAGSGAATDTLTLAERADLLWLQAIETSTNKALAEAGMTRDQINLFELHDSFTIMAALALEAAGFALRGMGWKLAQNGAIKPDGALPISTFGGLKSRGNPVGATGVYQAVEAVMQLRGTAGANQIANARTAMIQSVSGLGSSAFTHILSI